MNLEEIKQSANLDEDTKELCYLLDAPRINQYIILYQMLLRPTINFLSDDFVPELSESKTVIGHTFRRLNSLGLVEINIVVGRDKCYQVPIDKLEEVKQYLKNRILSFVVNWNRYKKNSQKDIDKTIKLLSKLKIDLEAIAKERLRKAICFSEMNSSNNYYKKHIEKNKKFLESM